jgi:hypothetical protein
MKIEEWKNDQRIFLIEDQHRFTYANLYESVHQQKKDILENIREEAFLLLEGKNNFSSYARFIGALLCGKKVLLCSAAQMKDSSYLTKLQTEFNKYQGEYENHKTPGSDLLSGSRFIVRTSGSSGKHFKLVLHNPENFFEKYKKTGPHFQKTLAFSPAESIAGIETLLEVLSQKAELITSLDDLSPAKITELIKIHSVDYFQTTPSYMNLLSVSKMVNFNTLGCLKKSPTVRSRLPKQS